jgi:hypothetical protein
MEFLNSIEVPYNIWATFFRPRDITEHIPGGRKDKFPILVDNEVIEVTNIELPMLDSGMSNHDTKHFQVRRRRNIAAQRVGRYWSRNMAEARLTSQETHIQ